MAAGLGRPLRIVQIGANDGESGDPLVDYLSRYGDTQALLIEPHPIAFDLLQRQYETNDSIFLARCAVGDPKKRLFALDEAFRAEYLDRWGQSPDIICSSNPDHVTSRVSRRLDVTIDEARKMIVELDVEFETLVSVLDSTGFGAEFDVLQVDVEGFDHEVIQSIDLLRHKIRLVSFERHVLGEDDYQELKHYLHANSFACYGDGPNEYAIKRIAGEMNNQ